MRSKRLQGQTQLDKCPNHCFLSRKRSIDTETIDVKKYSPGDLILAPLRLLTSLMCFSLYTQACERFI